MSRFWCLIYIVLLQKGADCELWFQSNKTFPPVSTHMYELKGDCSSRTVDTYIDLILCISYSCDVRTSSCVMLEFNIALFNCWK
jgi:hypothetical protein